MKLRNKKTGEIKDLECITVFDRPGKNDIGDAVDEFYTIAELNKEWEDYMPKEPLIRDRKVRKAVRAWADANNINSRHYHENDVKFNSLEHELTWIDTSIQFNEFEALEGLEDGKRYSIAELCGEEEE